VPDSLHILVDEFTTAGVPGITYEDIVLVNPEHDMRRFTDGAFAKTEARFYSTHRDIEHQLGKAIRIVHRELEQTLGGLFDSLRLPIALNTVIKLAKGLQTMPEGHFKAFRGYLSSREDRGTKGPSGAFTARIPTLELLYLGSEFPESEIAYFEENWKYYPKRDADSFTHAISRAREAKGLENQYVGKPSRFLLELMLVLSNFFSSFGSIHYRAVRVQLPEALDEGAPGTAGVSDVRSFLAIRTHRRNLRLKMEQKRLKDLGPPDWSGLGGGWI
jgi:hypothetical protein